MRFCPVYVHFLFFKECFVRIRILRTAEEQEIRRFCGVKEVKGIFTFNLFKKFFL